MNRVNGAEKGNAKAPKEKKSRLLLVLLAVILVLASALVFYLLRGRQLNAELLEKQPVVIMSQPQEFTVNLADEGRSRYLRATIVLAYDNKRLTRELNRKEPEIRDLIIGILRSKKAGELSTAEGIDDVRRQIRAELEERLLSGSLKEVYFTQFLMQ